MPQVTHLVVQRPRSFRFRPGDYVYLNVPAIAAYEWHPFTISSAPEQQGVPESHVGVLVWHMGTSIWVGGDPLVPTVPACHRVLPPRRHHLAARAGAGAVDQPAARVLRAPRGAAALREPPKGEVVALGEGW